ncbi:hypothetical protein BCR34DRAFT_597226 [Clohesyomyces aquaticus]|uniref:Nephrocystin 3-like N-terminal domain-containing protein n=1 Tax=Clohesyomyces aquaticus TaxID=1231657 RepID=A0A1Y2A3U7_9PLEO|nr:hypothetical protein BCR34DRAFT_597226 [Clohesyomyces aquaticus]
MVSSDFSYWKAAIDSLDPTLLPGIKSTVAGRVDILADVLQVAKQNQTTCMKKRWRFKNLNGETIILRDIMGRLIKWVDRFKAIGDIAIGTDQGAMSVPWAAVRFLLECVSSDVNTFGSIAESLESMARLITTYREFERLHLNGSSTIQRQLEEALIRLYTSILTALGYAVSYYKEPTALRITKSPFRMADNHMAGMREREDELLRISRMTDTETLNRLETITIELVDHMKRSDESIEEIENEKLRNWLSSFDFQRHHNDTAARRLPETGQWLLDHPTYQQWCNSNSPCFFLLQGIPGSGKTNMAWRVIDSLGPNHLVAYFYCSSTTTETARAQPENIMPCIVGQLALPSDPTLARLTGPIKAARQLRRSRKWYFEKPSNLLYVVGGYDPITIVIDAIDEIEEDQRYKFLNNLKEATSWSRLFKIFLTSRNNAQISCLFEEEYNFRVSPDDNDKDVEQFVSSSIDKVIREKILLGGSVSTELRECIKIALMDSAGEMFLWAKLHLSNFAA